MQAAYANFLWETEEDEDEDSLVKEMAAQQTYTTAATAWNEIWLPTAVFFFLLV